MTTRRSPDSILSTWLEEGPNELPDITRRAIAVGVRTTKQARRGRLARWLDPTVVLPLAFATIAVAVAVGGLYLLGTSAPGQAPGGVGAGPSASRGPDSPSPSVVVPAMTRTFVSPLYGYSVRYPADWTAVPATGLWWPPAWKAAGSPEPPFDRILLTPDGARFRAASATAPDGVPIDDWIDEFMTFSDEPGCAPARETQPEIVIDGRPGRVREGCDEVEATVVVGRRVYLFTLFGDDGQRAARPVFDELAATIDLRPEDAADAPSAAPS